MFGIPIGKGTDKTIIAKGKKVAMGIIIVDGQIEKGVQDSTAEENSSRLPTAVDAQAKRDRGQGMKVLE